MFGGVKHPAERRLGRFTDREAPRRCVVTVSDYRYPGDSMQQYGTSIGVNWRDIFPLDVPNLRYLLGWQRLT